MSRWLLILLVFTFVPSAHAEAWFDGLEPGGQVDVDDAIDGDTLRLTDGRELRLAAVEAPKPVPPRVNDDLDRRQAAAAALAERARAVLAEIAGHQTLMIYYDRRRNDRYGRIVAQVAVPSDRWVQAELLRQGLVRVHTTPDLAASAVPLLRIEAEARASRRGLWRLAAYQVRRPDELARWRDSFQLVEGRVGAVRRGASQTWLDFDGAERRRLEAAIPSPARKNFRAADFDLTRLVGKTVRVRGWVHWQDGPVIDVDHPAQIETLAR